MAKRSRRPDYKRLRCARLSVCLLSALLVEACAEPSATKLRVANWLPPSHVLVRDILVPWAERVRVATDGRVEIEVMSAPLGQPSASFDIARDELYAASNAWLGRRPGDGDHCGLRSFQRRLWLELGDVGDHGQGRHASH